MANLNGFFATKEHREHKGIVLVFYVILRGHPLRDPQP